MDFELHICEYNRKNRDFDRIYRPDGSGDYLFLLLKTPMRICRGDQVTITRENACLLYTPDAEQDYRAIGKFMNSYIHFGFPENPGQRFLLPTNEVFYPFNYDKIDEYIREIQLEQVSAQPFSGERIYYLLCQLLICAHRGIVPIGNGSKSDGDLYEQFCQLRLTMLRSYDQPWTMDQLCEIVNLEKSQLYTYYRKFFKTTPHADLLQARLDQARTMLTNEAVPIKEVAERCGFSSIPHFCRYFKKECGCTPGEYARR
ncbi:MAG: AraC family transcriptional regulator [Fusicatenibacter sp.]|nr:AraC family transcriptional regulator [Lachnospiraceae bacterium]MDY2937602.1 AraC family transcriptional regulator [Fusicatenibacter sp.]